MKLTEAEKEEIFNSFMEMAASISKIQSALAQSRAYNTQFPEFFEKIYQKGYLRGLEVGRGEHTKKLTQQN